MFYRFESGVFIEASSFSEAQTLLITKISNEEENPEQWYKCTCCGFSHSSSCPENPINNPNMEVAF